MAQDGGRAMPREDVSSGALKRDALGAPSLVFVALAAVAPLAACAANIPLAIGYGNGLAAPVDFVVVGAVLLLFSAGFTAMSEHMVNAGSFFAYVSCGLGRRAGMAAGYMALAAYSVLTICTSAMGGYILSNNLAMELGLQIPWWAISLAMQLAVWGLGALGVDVGARFLSVTLVLELVVVACLAVAVALEEGLEPFFAVASSAASPEAFLSGSPGLGLVFAFACYLGFETPADYGEEARDAHRTVPLATYASAVTVGVVFVVAALCLIVAVGADGVVAASRQEGAGTLLHGAVRAYLGEGLGHFYNWLYMASSVACWLSAHNAATRYIFAFARAGMLPRALARTHARRRSPVAAGAVQAGFAVLVVAACSLAGLSPYAQVGAVASTVACVGVMLLELMASVAAFRYLRLNAGKPGFAYGRFRSTVAPIAATLALAAVSVLVMGNLPALTEVKGVVPNALLTLLMPAAGAAGYVVAVLRDRQGKLPDPAGIRLERGEEGA